MNDKKKKEDNVKTQYLFNSKDFLDLIVGKAKAASVLERKQFWSMCAKITPMMGKEMCDRILSTLQDLEYGEDSEEMDFRILFEQRLRTQRKTTYDCIRLTVTMPDLVAWIGESDTLWESLVSVFHPIMTKEERKVIYDLIEKREFENPFLQQQRDMCLAAFDNKNRYRVRYVVKRENGRKVNQCAVAFKYKNVYYGGWNKPIREYNDMNGFCMIKKVTLIDND